MQCTRSLVKNWDLDCFRIVTKKQPELFRPDREQGVGHKPRLGNLHTNRHQLNLLWESIVWIWLRWTPSGYYPPAQKDLKHLCCSATKSCRNRAGLLPEHRWFFLLLKSKYINIDFLFESIIIFPQFLFQSFIPMCSVGNPWRGEALPQIFKCHFRAAG